MKSPKPFQLESIDAASHTANILLADECGLGKTLTAIEAALERGANKILVVCPKALRAHWIQEIREQDGDSILVVNYLPFNFDLTTQRWYIVTYEELSRVGSLYSIVWDYIIFDEAHRIKNASTRRSKAARRLHAVKVMALSGTPLERTPADLWAIFKALNVPHLPPYWAFVKKHVNLIPTYHGHVRPGSLIDPEAFRREFGRHIVRHTKAQVAPQLPPRIDIVEPVEMNVEQETLYWTVKRSSDIEVPIGDDLTPLLIQNVLTQITRLLQISVLPEMFDPKIRSAKLDWLNEHLDDLDEHQQTVIFTRFRNVAETVHKRYGAELFVGGHTQPPIAFTQGYVRMLVGTIDAMGEGLNLQNAAEAIFLDCHWSATKMTQAIDRIHRMDITEPKFVYFLQASPIDRLVFKAVQGKWSERDLVLQYGVMNMDDK